ncbi:MAG: mandelate racemase/muconate lactonizing enzyme family protein [Verrucomicrobia bacterium]|jgi:L-alanine-DL-glutamate epimerase-like enolase superfamily enzyme|nr:mandelate racemase/muconate lactonizing enzyme family protein [Verrucomicrobiota bacterium]
MKIESVDFFYLSMPVIRDIGDGSQDALLVRVIADNGLVGWGECEAAPLASIAAWCCPMSHSACKPVSHSVLGRRIESPADIRALTGEVRRNSFDLLQADHTLSGVDMALWDLLGKRRGEPAWKLLGWERAFAKIAYASQLFGDTPVETGDKARKVRAAGFRAAKFGWGPFGTHLAADEAHVRAARAGLGPDVALLVDAGTIWGEDVEEAAKRLPVLQECGALWLEEPFVSGALHAYHELGRRMRAPLRTAGGEGAHEPFMARNLVDFGGLGYVQIDAGRIGGLTSAYEVARHAEASGVTYVNHTFTTPLALSASLQPFAGMESSRLCEYPTESSALARNLTVEKIEPTPDGEIPIPDRPGLGMDIRLETVREYLVPVELRVAGKLIHQTPTI